MRNYDFHKLIKDDEIRDKASVRLTAGSSQTHDLVKDVFQTLANSDKDLFIKFRDKVLTLDQLKARIAERRFNVKYQCLDDLKGKIDPSFYQDLEDFEKHFKLTYPGNPTT